MIKNIIRSLRFAALLVVVMGVSGCSGNVRDQFADAIAQSVRRVPSTPGKAGLTWIAPELHASHYRTLFYGYDTVDYRLASNENAKTSAHDNFLVLFDARYGGDARHYEFAKIPGTPIRELSDYQHDAERCQIFNSLISSCLYRDRFSLVLSRAELERTRDTGLQFSLASKTRDFERLDLPPNYINGFLNAIGNR
ncbi:MAG: hypothetical protein PHG36_05475 [Dehalococcoidia bacterium]|nr:hypothetical protein [Dehalococcoidia bacterium]